MQKILLSLKSGLVLLGGAGATLSALFPQYAPVIGAACTLAAFVGGHIHGTSSAQAKAAAVVLSNAK